MVVRLKMQDRHLKYMERTAKSNGSMIFIDLSSESKIRLQ